MRTRRALLSLMLALFLFALPLSVSATDSAPEGGESSEAPPQTYSITYNTNGGAFPGGGAYFVQNDLPEGSWATVIGDVPSVDGNYFAGWYSSVDGKIYWGGNGFPITANTTLWATWTPIPMYTVTLHFNNDDGFTSTGRYHEGTSFDLTPYTINRQGYKFLGWTTDPAAAAPEFSPDGSLTLWWNVDIYAVWEKLVETTAAETSTPPASSSQAPPASAGSSQPPASSEPEPRNENPGGGIWKWLFILLVAVGAVAAVGTLIAGNARKKKQEQPGPADKPDEKKKDGEGK